ncbi:AKAP14 [Acanthosepion pharaonis]|uniref:AKAP14 n=1 Tax=Acanthosepion pharaonis TaxID=158019 RepID=A0A812B4S0_ACAPH|nr:AKAP14 [Sepia pharaonis]
MSVAAEECPQCEQLLDQFVSQTMFKVQREFCPKCSQQTRTTEWTYEFNDDYKIEDFKWGTIEEFNVNLGKKLIEDYVKTWDYDASWLFCIDFLRREEFEFDTHYKYQVRWSIPTRCKPIPRATASIFFTFLLSKVKPKNYPVEVFYVLETNRLIHRTNESRFREEWLKDIIESKTLLISSVDF